MWRLWVLRAALSDLEALWQALHQLNTPRLQSGFGKRSKHGQGFGVRYMKRGIAKKAVISMFKKGAKVKAKRKGPAEMLEAIRRKHPRQYDLPSLEEVSQLVAKLSHSGLPKPGGAGRRGGRTMEERFPTELGALRVEFDRHAEGDGLVHLFTVAKIPNGTCINSATNRLELV